MGRKCSQSWRPLALLLASAALAGCSTLPRERPEAPALPAVWADAPAGAEADLSVWWRSFDDPVLTQLVEEALESGPSVQLAALRVKEARALSRSTVTTYLPTLNASAQGAYSRTLEDAAGDDERMSAFYGPQISWEVPLYARIEATVVGARASNAAAQADMRGARVALAADVARAYVDLRAAQASRVALQQSVSNADELAGILAVSAGAGLVSEGDAADARRLAESTRARLPGVELELRRASNLLAVLRGLAPGTEDAGLSESINAPGGVPTPQLDGAPAAPADLVRLRPDVAQAEAQALFAAASLANARADLLPRLNLSGAISVSDTLIGAQVAPDSTTLQATPLISIPLFDWGRRINQIRARDSQFEQSLIAYRQTVVQAVAEAANALAALEQGRIRLEAARNAEDAAAVTARASRAAYGAGIQSLTDRLRADQQLIDATLTRISAEAEEARGAIATYRAFGGAGLQDEAGDGS